MNLALAPRTLTTGCSPIVFVTTPPHPASNARRMLFSDSVGGAEESRKGFSKRIPVNVMARLIAPPKYSGSWARGQGPGGGSRVDGYPLARRVALGPWPMTPSAHPIGPRL